MSQNDETLAEQWRWGWIWVSGQEIFLGLLQEELGGQYIGRSGRQLAAVVCRLLQQQCTLPFSLSCALIGWSLRPRSTAE